MPKMGGFCFLNLKKPYKVKDWYCRIGMDGNLHEPSPYLFGIIKFFKIKDKGNPVTGRSQVSETCLYRPNE